LGPDIDPCGSAPDPSASGPEPTYYLALQQFVPEEREDCGRCIWCGNAPPKNRAHLISRKLSCNASQTPVLRFSVCEDCNTKCGRLEEWVLRYSPLSWVRFMKYLGAKGAGDTSAVPSYFFAGNIGEWVVFHLDGKRHAYAVPTQMILRDDASALLLTESEAAAHAEEARDIMSSARKGDFLVDVRPSLPEGFAPRFLLHDRRCVLVCRHQEQAEWSRDSAKSMAADIGAPQRIQLRNTGQERQHFRWSRVNWARFCAKTAYEALCLFEGAATCIGPAYEKTREFVRAGVSQDYREVVFSESGPLTDKDVPGPVFVDLTRGQNAPVPIPALMIHAAPAMHVVALYEINGWVLATVVFAGFPPSVLVMAGPDAHLGDLYKLVYDDTEEAFHFACLAYDPSRPLIPWPVAGRLFERLRATYGLQFL